MALLMFGLVLCSVAVSGSVANPTFTFQPLCIYSRMHWNIGAAAIHMDSMVKREDGINPLYKTKGGITSAFQILLRSILYVLISLAMASSIQSRR